MGVAACHHHESRNQNSRQHSHPPGQSAVQKNVSHGMTSWLQPPAVSSTSSAAARCLIALWPGYAVSMRARIFSASCRTERTFSATSGEIDCCRSASSEFNRMPVTSSRN